MPASSLIGAEEGRSKKEEEVQKEEAEVAAEAGALTCPAGTGTRSAYFSASSVTASSGTAEEGNWWRNRVSVSRSLTHLVEVISCQCQMRYLTSMATPTTHKPDIL